MRKKSVITLINKIKKALIIIIAVLAVIVIWGVSGYNSLVSNEETVKSAWSQVENVYQRRLDLIPNLVSTVKGYASHEKETLESVVEARTKATRISVNPEDLTEENIAAFQKAQGEIGTALGRLLAITENYPDLKANQNFMELQAELAGTENRISTERRKYNEAARHYNTMVRRFPKNLLASMFGFGQKGYFEADETASQAPKVEF